MREVVAASKDSASARRDRRRDSLDRSLVRTRDEFLLGLVGSVDVERDGSAAGEESCSHALARWVDSTGAEDEPGSTSISSSSPSSGNSSSGVGRGRGASGRASLVLVIGPIFGEKKSESEVPSEAPWLK